MRTHYHILAWVSNDSSRSWDRIGVVASGLCAIHCAAMPFLLGVLTVTGLKWVADERTETLILIAAFALALASAIVSHSKGGNHLALAAFVAGFATILGARAGQGLISWIQPVGMTLGGLSVAVGHYLNLKASHCHADRA